jgi:hypothetical protein
MENCKMKNAKFALGLISIAGLLSLLYFLLMPDLSMLKKENPKKTALMEYQEKVTTSVEGDSSTPADYIERPNL